MADVLEKRTSEEALYDIDCSRMLPDGVTIVQVLSITATPDTSPDELAFGTPAVNVGAIEYDDHTAAIGTVIQVLISGGSVPAGRESRDYTVRCLFETTVDPVLEATVVLRVDDTPNP
jgi:hypothetical protein